MGITLLLIRYYIGKHLYLILIFFPIRSMLLSLNFETSIILLREHSMTENPPTNVHSFFSVKTHDDDILLRLGSSVFSRKWLPLRCLHRLQQAIGQMRDLSLVHQEGKFHQKSLRSSGTKYS